jgi:DNA-binding response OmpR family regulator
MLDGWLPNVDGFEVCRRIRQFDATTPILFYSGAAYESDKQKGVAAGANAYVTKPDFDGLLETMLDLIAKAGTDDDVSVSRADIRPAENRFSPQFLRVTAASNCSFVL